MLLEKDVILGPSRALAKAASGTLKSSESLKTDEVLQHARYISRYRSKSGRWIYVYDKTNKPGALSNGGSQVNNVAQRYANKNLRGKEYDKYRKKLRLKLAKASGKRIKLKKSRLQTNNVSQKHANKLKKESFNKHISSEKYDQKKVIGEAYLRSKKNIPHSYNNLVKIYGHLHF